MAKEDDDPLESDIQLVLNFLGRNSLKSRSRARLKLEIYRENPNRVEVSIKSKSPRFHKKYVLLVHS